MAETATHRTKTELALQILRDRIRTGALEPGRRLRLNLLTAELGMSPTPIREALRLLQADGLVTYRPHQGIVVAELSEPQTAEVIRLRCLLEGVRRGARGRVADVGSAARARAAAPALPRRDRGRAGPGHRRRQRGMAPRPLRGVRLAASARVHPPALGRLPVAHDVGAARSCRAVCARARGDHGGRAGR